MHPFALFTWLDRFLRLPPAETLEAYLCVSIGFIVLGPFAAMTYYHFVPGAVRRLPFLQWTILIVVTGVWLLSISEDFSAAVDRLLPFTRPERARITWTMVFVTSLVFAQLRLLGVRGAEGRPEFRRRTRVALR